MRTPLIAGNWKMHKTLAGARQLVGALRERIDGIATKAGEGRGINPLGVDIVICPPAQLLFPMAKAVADSPIRLGAQNAHFESEGAFTGEISPLMIKDTGATFVILGHSERRQHFSEGSELLARKVRAVVGEGLTAIYCVGETLEQREGGQTEQVIEGQIQEVITADIPAAKLAVAYEPVWAIGTGKTATPDQAQSAHQFIRSLLGGVYDREKAGGLRILYGGSVKPGNAGELLAQPDIDGALVGGASLEAEDFAAIISAGVDAAAAC